MRTRVIFIGALLFAFGCGSSAVEPAPQPPASSCPDTPLDLAFGDANNRTRVEGLSIEIDASCNMLLAGMTKGPIDFGGGPIGGADRFVFVAKLDPQGKHVWSRALPPGASITGKHVLAVDHEGGVFLAGHVFADVDLGGGKLGGTFEGGVSEIFVLALDAAGNHVWSKRLVGQHPADVGFAGGFDRRVESVAVDHDGNLVIGGSFRGDFDIGGKVLENKPYITDFPTDYRPDVFVAAYDPSGSLRWGERFGGDDYDRRVGLAVMPSGETIFTFSRSPDSKLPEEGYGVVLYTFSTGGSMTSQRLIPDSSLVEPPSLVAAEDGGFVIAGMGRLVVPMFGPLDSTFMARFDANGDPKLGVRVEGVPEILLRSAIPDDNGGIRAVGGFSGTLLFHGEKIGTAEGARGFDMHVQWDDPTNTVAVLGDAANAIAVAVTRSPSGAHVVLGVQAPFINPEDAGASSWTEGASLFLRRLK